MELLDITNRHKTKLQMNYAATMVIVRVPPYKHVWAMAKNY